VEQLKRESIDHRKKEVPHRNLGCCQRKTTPVPSASPRKWKKGLEYQGEVTNRAKSGNSSQSQKGETPGQRKEFKHSRPSAAGLEHPGEKKGENGSPRKISLARNFDERPKEGKSSKK